MRERQPLVRPGAANEVWSVDFVFDRIASGRTLKSYIPHITNMISR
jgi:putative transposase